MEKVTRFSISIDKKLTDRFDRLIKNKGFDNRSEAFRSLVRDYLIDEEWAKDKEIAATITLVYDHHVHDLQHELTHIQHNHHSNILSSLHVHLDHDNCLEVLVVKGKAKDIKKLSDNFSAVKGVKHSQLVRTTTGKGLQ